MAVERAAAAGRAAARPPRARKAVKGKGRAPFGPSARRWLAVGAFVLALLVGLPLAHAMLGDIGAVLLGTFAFGFAVGRMTIRR